jgi:hypothetical protein
MITKVKEGRDESRPYAGYTQTKENESYRRRGAIHCAFGKIECNLVLSTSVVYHADATLCRIARTLHFSENVFVFDAIRHDYNQLQL